MYVCVCNAITEDHVRGCVAAGAASAKEVRAACGMQPGCGTCTKRLRALVSQGRTASELADAITGGRLPLEVVPQPRPAAAIVTAGSGTGAGAGAASDTGLVNMDGLVHVNAGLGGTGLGDTGLGDVGLGDAGLTDTALVEAGLGGAKRGAASAA